MDEREGGKSPTSGAPKNDGRDLTRERFTSGN